VNNIQARIAPERSRAAARLRFLFSSFLEFSWQS
jgi:hypothetical protein